MAYLNKIDINGRTYYLQHLTDGQNEAKLPTPVKDDELLLRSQVINSVTSKESQSGYRVPLAASQGYSLNAKLNQEILDREADVDEEQARAEAAEKVLADNLNLEIQNRTDDVDAEEERALAAEKVLTDNLAQEIINRTNDVNEEQQRAENAEKVLTDNLNKEIQDRIDDVNAEEARALAAEKVLADNLTQEVTDRTKAVTDEQNRAVTKENEISNNLTSEINRAKAAEEVNAIAITTEQSRAEGIEANHESRIATMETFFKEADIDASQAFIDTLKEIQTYIEGDKTGAEEMVRAIGDNKNAIIKLNGSETTEGSVAKTVSDAKTELNAEIAKKVDKVDGKDLSSNDYTDDEKSKLEGIEAGANNYTHPIREAIYSGFYKISFDVLGHVSSVEAVTKEDITGLGVPAQDTTYEVAVATTETEDGVDGLLSATDKAKYDAYDTTIAGLLKRIEDLEKLVREYHPVTEPEPDEPESGETE